MGKCFVCGARLLNINLPCPKCGYKFDTEDNKECPNRRGAVCRITKGICQVPVGDYGKCPTKNEFERHNDF